jgi:hypothetical protein
MPRTRKPRAIFVCGSLNQTTQLHRVARALPELDCWFSPFFGDSLMEACRRAGLTERTILGAEARARCEAYLRTQGLAIDFEARANQYELVVACTDLAPMPRLRGVPTLVVQEGMTDPETWLSALVRASRVLPLWICSTTLTGTSGRYDAMCVASEGYRQLFVRRGAPADKLHVTGIPNFDDCARYRDNPLPYRGYVLACTSDLRETLRRDDRAAFIARVRKAAARRPVHFKLHPNERRWRALREIERHCPEAIVHCDGSAEQLIANCDVLFTQYSSVAFVGLALGKEVHSYYDLDELKQLLPIQNAGRSAEHIAEIARELLALPAVATVSQETGASA